MIDFKDLYIGNGWWNLTRYYPLMARKAQERDRQKQHYRSTGQRMTRTNKSSHLVGLLGECVFSFETAIKPNLDLNPLGDDGYDFKYEDKTFDIKTSQFLRDPDLKSELNPKFWADYYILVAIDINDKEKSGRIFGYATKEELQNAKLHDYGHGPKKFINHKNLHEGLPCFLPSVRKKHLLDTV